METSTHYKTLQLIQHLGGDPAPPVTPLWIAERVGEPEAVVKTALCDMTKSGWITGQPNKFGATIYYITRNGVDALELAQSNPKLIVNVAKWKTEVLSGMKDGDGGRTHGNWQRSEIDSAVLPTTKLEQFRRDAENFAIEAETALGQMRMLAFKFSKPEAKIAAMMRNGQIGYCETCNEIEEFSTTGKEGRFKKQCKKCRARKMRNARARKRNRQPTGAPANGG